MRHASLQSGHPARVWLKRFLLVLMAAGSLAGAALCGRLLLAEAYATYARENLGHARTAEAALASAELAVRLQPHSAGYQGLLARAERRHGDRQRAEQLYLGALRAAPANAIIWRDYAMLRVAGARYDAQLEHAVAQAQKLHPADRGMHLALAVTGLSTWDASPASLRRLWSRSIDFRLKHGRKEFLRYVFAAEREQTLCGQFGAEAALRDWCVQTLYARRRCYRSDLSANQRRDCQSFGAYLGQRQ